MGKLFVSASEIEVFDLCPRKWAYVYVEGRRGPPNDAAALGTRVHKILEQWLKDGTAPDTLTMEGEIAASGLHLLPPPRTPTLVCEEEFRFTSRRAWYSGFKDFRYRDANGLVHVGDHKTTKNFQWAKSLEEILCHSQALIYAVDEFFKNPSDDRLALDWIYYKTTGSRKAEPRFQIVTKDEVAELFFEHVDPVAGEITRLHHEVPQDASALDFAPNFSSCDAFGGCPFLSICNPSPTQRTQATMTQAGLSLTDKIKAMKAGRPVSPIHPPEHTQAPVQSFGGIFPPGAPAAQPALAPTAAAPVQAALPFALPVPQAAPPVPQAAAPAPLHVVEAAPAAPKPRGRPKKATAAAAPETPVAEVSADPLQNGGFILYIGCSPIGCEVTNALEYVAAAHDQLKEARGIAHYREMEYGKGPGELCKSLEDVLSYFALTGDVVLWDSQMELDTASVWLSKASKIVRAFR